MRGTTERSPHVNSGTMAPSVAHHEEALSAEAPIEAARSKRQQRSRRAGTERIERLCRRREGRRGDRRNETHTGQMQRREGQSVQRLHQRERQYVCG